MTVRSIGFALAALPLALAVGCHSQPGVQIATDRPARDAGADGGSDRGATSLDAAGVDRSRQDAARADTNRPEATRPDWARDANRLDAAAVDAPPADGKTTDAAGADGGGRRAFELLGAPLVFAPTPRAFGLSVVLRSGDPTALQLRVRDEELSAWSVQGPPRSPAVDIAQWTVDGLAPGRRYVYEVSASLDAGDAGRGGSPGSDAEAGSPAGPVVLYTGSAATAPSPGTPFTF